MSQAKTIQQLQGDVTTAEGKVQQVGASLQAEQKRAERLSSEIRSNEQRYEGLKDEIRSLSAELEGLYSQLNGLDNENDEDGSRAAAVESEIARCQSERSDCEEEIRDVKAELSQQKQERQAAQARIRQYAGLLRQHRQALQQVDQIFVGHIEERSMVRSGMEQISRMKYGASAGPRAGQLAQDIQACEQERQKVASLQTEITRYLGDGVTVQAPAAQKGTMSGPGGAGRASASAAGTQAPGTAPQTGNKMPDAGPSRIETAQTTAADIAPPPVVSMAPPGGRQQTDVSDIRQMAQENRGKWADEAGFMCAGAAAAGMAAQEKESAPAKKESPFQKRADELHEQYSRMEKMRNEAVSFSLNMKNADKAVMMNRIAEDFDWKAKEMDEEQVKLEEQYQQLMKRYAELANGPETEKTREMQHQISQEMVEVGAAKEMLRSHSEFFKTHVDAIRRDYPVKTKFAGVRGKKMSECMLSMIPQQGLAVENFEGTCGCCCIAEAIELLGGSATEAKIIEFARAHKLCTDKKIKDRYSNKKKIRIIGDNGGTTGAEREKILKGLGYQCEPDYKGSLGNIYQQLQAGKVAMIAIDHHVLEKKSEQKHSLFSISSADHVVMITGVEVDENGKPCGLWIHDTGGINKGQTEYYCSKKNLKKWMGAVGAVVQYVSQ